MRRPWPLVVALTLAAIVVLMAAMLVQITRRERTRPAEIAQQRFALAQRAAVLDVAVVTTPETAPLWNGAVLAMETTPSRRPLRLHRFAATPATELDVARAIARDPRFIAVIGHGASARTSEAAVAYDAHGLLFLTTSTDAALTRAAALVFRIVPADKTISRAIAEALRPGGAVAAAEGRTVRNAGVLYVRTPHFVFTPFVDDVVHALSMAGLAVVFQRPYAADLTTPDGNDELRRELFDADGAPNAFRAAVLLDDSPANAQRALARLRTMRDQPASIALGAAATVPNDCLGEYLRGGGAWSFVPIAPDAAPRPGGTYVVTDFCRDAPDTRPAARAYAARFGAELGEAAAHGYEAVSVLAQALSRAESPAPMDVAAVLRAGSFRSLRAGRTLSFLPNGGVAGKGIFLARLRR
jgi:branched-chain amino acid transport system substrate-binding protein